SKMYVAFDEGGDPNLGSDLASFNGKLLRLNPDATTPDDQPKLSPLLSARLPSPRGLDWDRSTGRLWTADATHIGSVLWPRQPSALAVARNAVFVASESGLVRAGIDRERPNRLLASTTLVDGLSVAAVAVAPDGTIYFATNDSLGVIPAVR